MDVTAVRHRLEVQSEAYASYSPDFDISVPIDKIHNSIKHIKRSMNTKWVHTLVIQTLWFHPLSHAQNSIVVQHPHVYIKELNFEAPFSLDEPEFLQHRCYAVNYFWSSQLGKSHIPLCIPMSFFLGHIQPPTWLPSQAWSSTRWKQEEQMNWLLNCRVVE